MPRASVLVAIGFAAGVGSGLLGVGGGIVMVPALVMAAGFAQRRAHATSLAAIIPIGIVGAALFMADGEIDYGIASMLALGGIVGVPFGVRALAKLPETALRIAFGGASLVAGVRLVVG